MPLGDETREEKSRVLRAPGVAFAVALVALVCGFPVHAAAATADARGAAAKLSNDAFALLGSLNSGGAAGESNPLLGPVAGLAGDAQTLSQALDRGDRGAAARAMGALESDRAAIDAALSAHPGALKSRSDWNSLKHEIDALSAGVHPAPPSAAPAPAPRLGSSGGEPTEGAPQVRITSYSARGDVAHVKGWLEGTNLKSAGLYDHGQRVGTLNIGKGRGEERFNFDLELHGVTPSTAIRVYDGAGRMAEARVAPPGASDMTGAGLEVGESAPVSGGESAAPRSGASSGESNVVEIPSHGSPRRGGLAEHSSLDNVVINILAVEPLGQAERSYEVIGQITGRSVRRAGIYVDGRLAARIALHAGLAAQGFDVTFRMLGREAAVRAYGTGGQYVESQFDVNANAGVAGLPAGTLMPYGTVNPYAAGMGAAPYGYNPYYPYPYAYGVSPYGTLPYGTVPNGALVRPYGSGYPYPAAPPRTAPW